MVNKNLYLVMAMKRSGHHAIINWLCKQHGNIVHINNSVDGWESKSLECPGHSAGRKTTYGESPDSLCYSIEDFDISDYESFDFKSFSQVKNSENYYPILLIRDFKNWIASCLKRREAKGDHRDVYDSLQKSYVNDRKDRKPSRISLYEKHINCSFDNPNGFIFVCYDLWVESVGYRKEISRRLNIEFTDSGFEDVSPFGNGSSFDLRNKERASDMNVLERYKLYETDSEYKNIMLENRELQEKFDIFKQSEANARNS